MQRFGLSERRVCATLGVHRSTVRRQLKRGDDEEQLTADIIRLANQYGRYGYRPVTALLNQAGVDVPSVGFIEYCMDRESGLVSHKPAAKS